MTTLVTNNASTTLAASITAASTTINLLSGTGAEFPQPAAGQHFWATLQNAAGAIEVVQVTSMATDTATAVRGQDGTAAHGRSSNLSPAFHGSAAVPS
jgi:hypothetical protein